MVAPANRPNPLPPSFWSLFRAVMDTCGIVTALDHGPSTLWREPGRHEDAKADDTEGWSDGEMRPRT